MISAEQMRAGRALVGLSQKELASLANLGESTVRDFEAGRRVPGVNNIAAIQRALEQAGVVFLAAGENVPGGTGVRFAR